MDVVRIELEVPQVYRGCSECTFRKWRFRMIVISDTTPIISLIKIESLDVLEKMYKKIIIPKAINIEFIVK